MSRLTHELREAQRNRRAGGAAALGAVGSATSYSGRLPSKKKNGVQEGF